MGRLAHSPKRTFAIRLPETVFYTLIALRPELVDPAGDKFKYGAIVKYFTRLIMEDLENVARITNEGKGEAA